MQQQKKVMVEEKQISSSACERGREEGGEIKILTTEGNTVAEEFFSIF